MKKLLSVFLLAFILVLAACGSDDSKTKDEPEKETPEVEESTKQDEVKKDEPVVEEEPENQDEAQENGSTIDEKPEESTWDDLKEQDRIIGKSDKDFSEVTKSKPNDVRNDVTGNWRILKISENVNIEEYALSYADMYMKDDEVHFIVNFNYHTTTWLNELGGLLYVDIREYEKKEEHDAKKLGNGMLLKSYVIYPDGDIQELEI